MIGTPPHLRAGLALKRLVEEKLDVVTLPDRDAEEFFLDLRVRFALNHLAGTARPEGHVFVDALNQNPQKAGFLLAGLPHDFATHERFRNELSLFHLDTSDYRDEPKRRWAFNRSLNERYTSKNILTQRLLYHLDRSGATGLGAKSRPLGDGFSLNYREGLARESRRWQHWSRGPFRKEEPMRAQPSRPLPRACS